jgi:hypothetical protein
MEARLACSSKRWEKHCDAPRNGPKFGTLQTLYPYILRSCEVHYNNIYGIIKGSTWHGFHHANHHVFPI